MLPGFKEYMIRKVPFNKKYSYEDFEMLPIVQSGVWVSECGRFNLIKQDKETYCLHIIKDRELFNGYEKFCGSFEYISAAYHELCKTFEKNKKMDQNLPFSLE